MPTDTDQQHLDRQMDATYEHIKEWMDRLDAGQDEDSEEGSIYDYPLAVISEVGRPYTVVLCTGGPHIEIVAEGLNTARLEGYWWGSRATRHDYGEMPLTRLLDFFIERDTF